MLSILIFIGSSLLLATGSALLVYPLFFAKSVPLGTITTWAGIIALPCVIFYSIKSFHPPKSEFMRVFRSINLIIIFLAACWGIVSYFLARNWSYSFSGYAEGFVGSDRAYIVFQQYTIFSVLLPLVFLLMFLLSRAYKSRFQK
jgi:hypothetical protein